MSESDDTRGLSLRELVLEVREELHQITDTTNKRLTALEDWQEKRSGAEWAFGGVRMWLGVVVSIISLLIGIFAFQIASNSVQKTSAANTQPPGFSAYAAGVDISAWNVSTGSPGGLSFECARVSVGQFLDPAYPSHLAAIKAEGLIPCAYTFGVNMSGAAQATLALNNDRGISIIALDWEHNAIAPGTMTTAEAKDFVTTVHAAGNKVGLYHSSSGFPNVGQDWNWVAQWGTSTPSIAWELWQWQGPPLDRDLYNGAAAALKAWAADQKLYIGSRTAVTNLSQVAPLITYFTAVKVTLKRYITNLQAVTKPTPYQKAELSTYIARYQVMLADLHYLGAVRAVVGYIATLKSVLHPSVAQEAKLVLYETRLAGWLQNPRVL